MDTRASNSSDVLSKIVTVLAIIGALNWGLVGFFNWNLVHAIFGGAQPEIPSTASRVIYAIVGIAGLIALGLLPKTHTEPVGKHVDRTTTTPTSTIVR